MSYAILYADHLLLFIREVNLFWLRPTVQETKKPAKYTGLPMTPSVIN